MAEQVNDITVSLGAGLRCELRIRGHLSVADEPEEMGGQDEGPSPSELFLASLGGCVAITLRMYADLKGWLLESVEVELSSDWVTREDLEDWPEGEERRKIPRIVRKIRVKGALDESQIERLHYIARRCQVHRIITENPLVVDDLMLDN